MKEKFEEDNQNEEVAEEQLQELIKEAGDEVRSRKKEALARHLKRLQDAVAEGVAHRKKSITI